MFINRKTASDTRQVKQEDYKHQLNQLSTQYENQLQQLNIQFFNSLKTIEHQVQFSKLHEKRAGIISDLYQKLEDVFSGTTFLVFVLQHRKVESQVERAKELFSKCFELRDYYKKNKLYFGKEVSDNLDKLISTMQGPSKISFWEYKLHDKPEEEIVKEMKEWSKERPNIENTLKLLEEEFRTMLGSSNKELNAVNK